MRARGVFPIGIVCALSLAACSSTSGPRFSDLGANLSDHTPTNHRVNDAECTATAPPGTCGCTARTCPDMAGPSDGGFIAFQCESDNECSGSNARCASSVVIAGCSCVADSCASDTDCPSGETCACHGSAYTYGAGSSCVPGNCRTDADCGSHGYCSPNPSGGCGSVGGYYCHTKSDTCANDEDCNDAAMSCNWSSTSKRWECVLQLGCG